jgi:uroporphyrinogen-III synthase
MRLIVTRPEREAQRWVQSLSDAGFEALALPLIALAPAADQAALHSAWLRLDDYVAVMFVSGNAVDHFFAAKPAPALCFSSHSAIKTRAWATGPGTTAALLRAGVPASLIDAPAADAAQFDSEALWQVVGTRLLPGQRVLIVRGSDASGVGSTQGVGREWFANRVAQAAAQVDFVVAYQRGLPDLKDEDLLLARRAATDGSVWLFSSSEAIVNLQALLPRQNWARARAVATHARIAEAARAAGFGVVRESSPKLAQLLASIESLK